MGTKTQISALSYVSPRPQVKKESPNMGTKTWISASSHRHRHRTVKKESPNMGTKTMFPIKDDFSIAMGEKRIPKHGDENPY